MTMQSGPERGDFIHSVAGMLMGVCILRNSASCVALRVLMRGAPCLD